MGKGAATPGGGPPRHATRWGGDVAVSGYAWVSLGDASRGPDAPATRLRHAAAQRRAQRRRHATAQRRGGGERLSFSSAAGAAARRGGGRAEEAGRDAAAAALGDAAEGCPALG